MWTFLFAKWPAARNRQRKFVTVDTFVTGALTATSGRNAEPVPTHVTGVTVLGVIVPDVGWPAAFRKESLTIRLKP